MKGVFAILFLAVIVIAGIAHPAFAQYSTTQDPITINLAPLYPEPYSVVTVSPQSTLVDLSASTVTISVNGKVISKGSGQVTAQVAVGGPGSTTRISVSVVASDQTYSKDLVIHPAGVALITEPVSTVHPLYQGAPLISAQSRVRLIALADVESAPGKVIPSSSLVYTWKFGDQVLQSASGLGKSVLSAVAPVRYRDADITVTVTSQDNTYVAQAQTTISPIDPYLRIYQNDPLLGPLFNHVLANSITMADAEDTFRVVPYYFAGFPGLVWSVNNTQSGADQDLTVRSSGNGQGTALMAVSAKSTDSSQSADSTVSIHFGAAKSLGIFGL